MIIAQLTDPHICAGSQHPGADYWAENSRRLRSAVRSLSAETEPPAVVVATGDLVEDGSIASYDRLLEALDGLAIPFWPVPGNHDSRVNIRKAFPAMPWEKHHASWAQLVPDTDVKIVALDSTLAGQAGGFVDGERLEWLADQIDQALWAHQPVIVAMHHPPFLTGIDWMDAVGFDGLDDLQKVLLDHVPTRIISGHFHRPITAQLGQIAASVGIATAPHVHLDLSNSAVPAIVNDPIGYQLHVVPNDDNATVISHTRYVDRASVPQPIQLKI